MRLTFLGGADEVGASSTLIEIAGKTILVDAGIRISPKTNRGIEGDQLPDLHPITQAGGIDYLLVTHAHTDHTGALPLVVEQYPHVPVIATRPTIDLTRVLQSDAQRIMRSKQEEEGELPIFDEVASGRLMEAFQPVELRTPVKLGDALQVTFHASGHIAGAAMLVFESEEGTLVMGGDMSKAAQRAVVGIALPRIKADALVLESTYGGKLHANRAVEEKRLMQTLRQITERGGKVLIPAFALGRAQELLQIILAHRAELSVPVYADGMVRAVCRAYSGFADWLPPRTVEAAGEEPLFFRDGVRPIDNVAQREEVIHGGPAVIVASSGMLTGGASAAYAKHLAPHPANAILLTGYQDEEAPGRFLQRMMKERQEGQDVTFKIGDAAVTLRCDVDSYSLSAHADEGELVSIADALNPDDTMLVHGDPTARYSVATKLRERGRAVQQPRSGQTLELTYARRPWALGRVKEGHETRPVSVPDLWAALQPDNFYSARELARAWWGSDEHAADMAQAVLADGVHFAADWRLKDTFRARTAEQVERARKQRAIMQNHPALVGQLVVLRDSNDRPRAAVVVGAGSEGFEAVVEGTKGRHCPADALLWTVGLWAGAPEERGMKDALTKLAKQARALKDTLLPYERRAALVGQRVTPESLLPAELPPDVTRETALLAVILALAGDGGAQDGTGISTRRALAGEPVEMNVARQTAMGLFPPEARLRKVGMEVHRRRLVLNFDFPERAAAQYGDLIETLEDQTGWNVVVNPTINNQALGVALSDLLPAGVLVVKGPSFFTDRREVAIEIEGDGDLAALAQDYLALTGFRLKVTRRGEGKPAPIPLTEGAAPGVGKPLEINAAYALVKGALNTPALYRTSLKNGAIVLAFISPQVGARYADAIAALAEMTGYPMSIHPHPNQQQILQICGQVLRGWQVKKGPGIFVDRAEVAVTLAPSDDAPDIERIRAEFAQQTGYTLVVNWA